MTTMVLINEGKKSRSMMAVASSQSMMAVASSQSMMAVASSQSMMAVASEARRRLDVVGCGMLRPLAAEASILEDEKKETEDV